MKRRTLVATAVAVLVLAALFWRCREPVTHVEPAQQGGHLEGTRTNRDTRRDRDEATVSGRVTRSDGTAIKGVLIAIDDDTEHIVLTGVAGAWVISGVKKGNQTLTATARGYLPVIKKLAVSENTVVDVVLEAGGVVVEGKVGDAGGGTIANARVELASHAPDTDAQFVAITSFDGHYELSLAEGTYEIVASHDDYVATRKTIEVESPGPLHQDLELTPGGVIRGKVVMRDSGAPATTGEVAARTRGPTMGISPSKIDGGEFELRRVPAGLVEITAHGRDFSSFQPLLVPIGVGEQVTDVTVIVDRAFAISGRTVVKGKHEVAIPDVDIVAYGQGLAGVRRDSTSDPSGHFELHGLPRGIYELSSRGNSAVPLFGGERAFPKVEVGDHDVTDVVIELELGARVTGRVEPASPGAVRIAGRGLFLSTQIGADGTFVFPHVPDGEWRATARTSDGTGSSELTVTASSPRDIVIKTIKQGELIGRVIDQRGRPVDGAHLELRPSGVRQASWGSTGSNGRFRFQNIEAGPYQLSATTRDEAESSRSIELQIQAGTQTTVELQVTTADLSLSGVVVDATGGTVADARVSIKRHVMHRDEEGKSQTALTLDLGQTVSGVEGVFTFEHLAAGSYRIEAEGPRGDTYGVHERVGISDRARVVLRPLGQLSGRVMYGERPVDEFSVRCNDMQARATDRSGYYGFSFLKPGRYECTADTRVGRATSSVDVKESPVTLDLHIQRRGSISGIYADYLTGEPVANAYVMPAGRRFLERAARGELRPTDANGRFHLDEIDPDPDHELVAYETDLDGYEPLYKSFALKPGETLELGTIEAARPRTNGTLGLKGNFERDGIVLTTVAPAAAAAGIRIGDVVTGINGREPSRLRMHLWDGFVIGRSYKVTLARGATVIVVAQKRDR